MAGIHGTAPEWDTDQCFALCNAPFPGLELGCAGLCVSGVVVCVRRGCVCPAWLCVFSVARIHRPASEGDTDQHFAVFVSFLSQGASFASINVTVWQQCSHCVFYFILFPIKPPQHGKFSCKIQCTKLSVNIRGPKEEQLILDARNRYTSIFLLLFLIIAQTCRKAWHMALTIQTNTKYLFNFRMCLCVCVL